MKTFVSMLVALSVIAGVAATAVQAEKFGARSYWLHRDANTN
jgi:uncharacterized protein YxeA